MLNWLEHFCYSTLTSSLTSPTKGLQGTWTEFVAYMYRCAYSVAYINMNRGSQESQWRSSVVRMVRRVRRLVAFSGGRWWSDVDISPNQDATGVIFGLWAQPAKLEEFPTHVCKSNAPKGLLRMLFSDWLSVPRGGLSPCKVGESWAFGFTSDAIFGNAGPPIGQRTEASASSIMTSTHALEFSSRAIVVYCGSFTCEMKIARRIHMTFVSLHTMTTSSNAVNETTHDLKR